MANELNNSPFHEAMNAMLAGPAQGPIADQATVDPAGFTGTDPDPDLIERTPQEPEDRARSALVQRLCETVREDRAYWDKQAFNNMRADMSFAAGKQWPSHANDIFADDAEQRYVANIILRHIHQRTASLYAKNPRVVARRRQRLLNTIWDGRMQSLQEAAMALQSGFPDPQAMAVIMDAQRVYAAQVQLERIGRTLELLFEHQLDELPQSFKVQMKALIRRALTTGVGYLKVGFQRVMKNRPEVDAQMYDITQKLATLERISADLHDGVVQEDSPEIAEMRGILQQLGQTDQIVVREGLTISYPDSTAIIPDRACKQLRGFIGCEHVTEEYFLTREQIQEIYRKDVGSKGATYRPKGTGLGEYIRDNTGGDGDKNLANERFCVWEMYHKPTGQIFTLCDGYPDFLEEPAEPDVYLERFFPWFPFVVNEVYHDEHVFPPSDVRLLFHMQMEINRARQGLAEHRRAARPKTVTRSGVLSVNDKEAIETAKANSVIELEGIQPGEKVEDVLQAYKGPPIDPALYDTSPAMDDVLRVGGQQEANIGGTSNATATESSIAEGSRLSSVSSTIDDLDEFLTEVARAAGHVLLLETSVETVRQVVGPGAVWPDLRREEVARDIFLEIEAASTGRPNRAQELQVAREVYPLLMQIPGFSPEWLGRELLRRMDDRIDPTDAFAAGTPSIQAMNRMSQMAAGGPGQDPNAQGDHGADNAPGTDPGQVNDAPRPEAARQGQGAMPAILSA